jgi:serine/threonine protein kinase
MTDDKINSSSPTYLLEEGMTIKNRWKIQNFIAKGGKGEVYLAQQLNLDRQVALKIMSQEFIKSLEDDEEEITSETMRFHREVKVMARMQHPNILQVYDFDQLEMNGLKLDYIIMEYVPGPTLRQEMPEKGFGHDKNKVKKWLKKYFFPILDGMKAVHDKGIVHRDMKPENVLVDDETPKIMDFGIAGGYHMDNVTQTHHMLGTITYMPEEQFVDLALTDVRVDIYALGKILYEVVEGKMRKGRDKPFNSVALKEPETNFFKILDLIIQQTTAKDRNQRTPSVKRLYDSLEELVLESEEKKYSPTNLVHKYWKYLFGISAVVILIFISAVTMHLNSEKTEPAPDKNYIQNQPPATKSETIALPFSRFNFKKNQPTAIPDIHTSKSLPASLLATDGMTMILLDGAKVMLPVDDTTILEREQIKQNITVPTFYMDKTKITNHLYVQFLNEIDEIEVKGKSVLLNTDLLLLLGEVLEGYEPITFKDGKFRVKSNDIARPVLRLTPIGALAYAQFYGKALPMMEQWWLAVQTSRGKMSLENRVSSSQSQTKALNGNSMMMHGKSSEVKPLSNSHSSEIQAVTQTTASQAGIQGLEQNVNEWTMGISSDGTPQFHIHGGIGELGNRESYLERQPWEAFSRVGFRTVLNIDGRK